MANFIVRCAETRAYRTRYEVQASSAEEARNLVSNGAGVETDDEFIETTDRRVLECLPGELEISKTEELP